MVRLKNPEKAAALFGDWKEALLWACLQGVMGEVYGDDQENPGTAMAVLGDFCFLAGRPEQEMLVCRKGGLSREFLIMIPQNDTWAEMIETCFGQRARAVKRYAIQKEPEAFDIEKLQRAVESLKAGYKLCMIDRECYEQCLSQEWSRDLVSEFKDYEEYRRLGVGVAVMKDGVIVSGASSYGRYREGIEIEIDTREDHRQKGLAYACGAGLILECLKRGLYPSWDAQNPVSAALAEKLGYHRGEPYPAYEVWRGQ